MMRGMMLVFPVCIRVKDSKASSMVPNPPGKRAMASECLTKLSLRVKKYLKVKSLVSPRMVSLGSCSKGSSMLRAKPCLRPAPAWAAPMIPSPPPVMTI